MFTIVYRLFDRCKSQFLYQRLFQALTSLCHCVSRLHFRIIDQLFMFCHGTID